MGWERDLSPFLLGPCELYDGMVSLTFESAWQYAKVYAEHVNTVWGKKIGDPITCIPTPKYWDWAKEGWANPRAVRYPMGKGRKPLYSLWKGQKLDYITARKVIYAPLYAEAVQKTEGFKTLVALARQLPVIILRDFDGYDHEALGMSLCDVLNNPHRKMGHSFVLKMLITGDEALKQFG
jgi:hypothetical protein